MMKNKKYCSEKKWGPNNKRRQPYSPAPTNDTGW
jgi:hypothetical protein